MFNLFSEKRPSLTTLMLIELVKGQKKIMATLNDVKDAITRLGMDVGVQIEAAKNAILRAQAGDPAALDEVVASLNGIGIAVKEATEGFNSTN